MLRTKKSLIFTLTAIIVLLVLAYFGYAWYLANQPVSQAQNEQFLEERTIVINKVKALTQIPNEDPQLFTVNDANLLKSQQAFFKDAVNGDILLIFQTSGIAILFRNSTNQIISSGPISFQQPTATSTSN